MKATLILEDGTRFEGKALGAEGTCFGEVIFSTSMTGYQELLTDPSYRGQILVSTLAHVGNVGINEDDHESKQAWLSGFVVQNTPRRYSNWRATQGLPEWLEQQGVTSICELDTRAVVKHIRSSGAMRGAICHGDPPDDLLERVKDSPILKGRDLVQEVTCQEIATKGDAPHHVVAYDFGMKNYMMDLLLARGLRVTRVPATTTASEVLKLKPDGIFLSNGPGDPAALESIVGEIRELLGQVPIFGICLGHQLLARALGAKTYKLKFGHHGTNHPVKNLRTGAVEITTQNHGFAVDPESLPEGVVMTHLNLNDGTCEGMECSKRKAFAVQYHPENAPGPHDSRYLFQQFLQSIREGCHA
jgi:carbamoyl-phosphate synthase small subunit